MRTLLFSVLKHRTEDPAVLDDCRKLLGRISEVEDARNTITHSSWAAGNRSETVTRIKMTAKMKKGWDIKFEQMTADELQRTADAAAVVENEVMDFMFRILGSGNAAKDG